ncbi:MAG TPA: BTAD domain-containing putative transcriptional regulator [Anaerolineales bacterium]|nr:BTAD domain-containing putative transcriptional regulator [Anaerolineales bacterium]
MKARGSLRKALTFLRKNFTGDIILSDPENVQLNPAVSLWVDVLEFERQAHNFLTDPSAEPTTIDIDLYRGDLLCEFFDEWILPLREHYRSLYLDVLLRDVENLRSQSQYQSVIERAQKILVIDPANERAHQHLMFCHITLGDRYKALQQYESCRRALQEELSAEPARETQSLYNWIELATTELSAMAARLTNLPIPISSFVGRGRELATIKGLLLNARLVTLTGAGGSGKTRLAIHAATDLIDSFKDGVWWVELAPLADPALVPSAVAKALGISMQTDQLLIEVLARFLRTRKTLLILDNCEHLIDACAQLTERLLRACPDLKILCTSREALGLTGERVWHTPTLSLPDPKKVSLTDLLMPYEGIRLFIDRAIAVKPDFTLTEKNASAVAQICQRLDGIPLAIELAAARVKSMTVGQIASRLDDCFQLLTAVNRTSPARHQTLRAAIDWSYDLLPDAERRLFCRLSVFSGGWTLEAAESVCCGDGLVKQEILNVLARLVDKSLVLSMDGQRYGLLETIKQYASEKLALAGDLDWMYQNHLNYYLNLAQTGDEMIRGPEQMTWLALLKAEQDNLAIAMERALDSPSTVETGCDLVCFLCWYWKMAGDFIAMKHWLEVAFSRSEDLGKSPTKAMLLFNAGLCSILGLNWLEPIQAQSLLEKSLGIWRELGLEFTVQGAKPQLILGWIQKRYFDNDNGYHYINQAATLFEERGDVWWQAWALNFLGSGLVDDSKDSQHTLEVLEKETRLWEKTGDTCTSAVVLWDLAGLACERGDFLLAQGYLKEALQRFEKLGARSYLLQTLVHLGDTARALKQYDQAESYYRESLPLVHATLYYPWLARIYQGLGYVMLGKGDLQQAWECFHEALNSSRDLNFRHGQVHYIAGNAAMAVVHGQLGFAARLFGAFFAQPQSLQSDVKTDQKILFAVDQREIRGYLDFCKSRIDKGAFEKAWKLGSCLSLQEAVNEIMIARQG